MAYTLTEATICWDCKKAIGGCSWADDCIPVEGWTAKETLKKSGNLEYMSYSVTECPLFVRDAYNYGMIRLGDPKCRNLILEKR